MHARCMLIYWEDNLNEWDISFFGNFEHNICCDWVVALFWLHDISKTNYIMEWVWVSVHANEEWQLTQIDSTKLWLLLHIQTVTTICCTECIQNIALYNLSHCMSPPWFLSFCTRLKMFVWHKKHWFFSFKLNPLNGFAYLFLIHPKS